MRLAEFAQKVNEPDFWNEPDKAREITKQQKSLADVIDAYEQVEGLWGDVNTAIELAEELEGAGENASEYKEEACALAESFCDKMRSLELQTMLTGEYDHGSAILSIHAGMGGLDAQDWAKILLRMYKRWGDDKGYTVKTLDLQNDPEAGIKSATLSFQGENAYGFLRSEKGVHRLVRISPYNTSGKRMTSFASVDVMPELDDDVSVDISPSDIEMQTYRSTGSGGQHVNTTDSAVRLIHKPTGVVVQCQSERSQKMNRETAMKMLVGKLLEIKMAEQKEKISEIAGDYSQSTWGSQVRSYVFQPYTIVKDHRTNAENGDVQAVIDGDLDLFIEAYLRSDANTSANGGA